MFDLLVEAARQGTTVVFITHDITLAAAADKVVSMLDGTVESVAARTGEPAAGTAPGSLPQITAGIAS